MGRFAAGFVAGGLLSAVGLTVVVSDRRTRKRIMREGRRMAHRAGDMLDGVTKRF